MYWTAMQNFYQGIIVFTFPSSEGHLIPDSNPSNSCRDVSLKTKIKSGHRQSHQDSSIFVQKLMSINQSEVIKTFLQIDV